MNLLWLRLTACTLLFTNFCRALVQSAGFVRPQETETLNNDISKTGVVVLNRSLLNPSLAEEPVGLRICPCVT